jgi:Putative Flp pilus-assembly TadE/G-like
MSFKAPAGNPVCVRTVRGRTQAGQALILFALVLPLVIGMLGLAIEGGRVWVEYRKMQSAADLAALIAAQDLPCGTSATTSDASCRSTAAALACTYAQNNGFQNSVTACVAGSDSVTANKNTSANSYVPPLTCSPYDFIDYGSNGNPGCKPKSNGGVGFYDYVEVNLSDNLGTVPILNIPVTLGTHAIARHGVPSRKDYAVSILSPNTCSITLQGTLTFFVNGVTYSNGSICTVGNHDRLGCDGGFWTASSASDPGHLVTYTGGTPAFAPPACDTKSGTSWVTASQDSSDNYRNSQPPIKDPYCNSLSPPYTGADAVVHVGTGFTDTTCATVATGSSSSYAGCPDCTKLGQWYGIGAAKWGAQGSVNFKKGTGPYEMFPGVYDGFSPGTSDKIYFNPGVYTFTGNFDTSNGQYCIFGAPACDTSHCATDAFDPQSSAGDQWYFACSPFGRWDALLSRTGAPNGGPSTTAPTFEDNVSHSTAGAPTLNGITINMVNGASMSGNGAGNRGPSFITAPDPCPGNGSSGWGAGSYSSGYSAGPPQAVQFPEGTSSASAVFTYGSTEPWVTRSPSTSRYLSVSGSDNIYPSMDFTVAGECTQNNWEVWPGEMPTGQHVHFLIFDRTGAVVQMGGNVPQQWDGILYAPTSDLGLNGTSGATGPPFIHGQIVGNTLTTNGTDNVSLIYRPCGQTDVCASGLGTQLIQ